MRFRLLVLLILLLAVVYGAFWYSLAGEAEDIARSRVESLDARGIDTAHGSIEVSGFPYRLAVGIDRLTLETRRGTIRWSVAVPRLDLFTHPWTPNHIVATAPDLEAGVGSLRLRAPEARASWVADANSNSLDIDLGSVSIGPYAETPVRVGGVEIHLRLPAEIAESESALFGAERADVALSLRDLALGPLASGAPAAEVRKVEIRAVLHGALRFPATAETLAAWRDAGGTLDLAAIDIGWGTVSVSGSGSLALDEDFRPLGALSLRVTRPSGLVNYFAARGLLEPRGASAALEALRALERSAGDGAIDLPLTLQDGLLLLGPMPIAELPPLVDRSAAAG